MIPINPMLPPFRPRRRGYRSPEFIQSQIDLCDDALIGMIGGLGSILAGAISALIAAIFWDYFFGKEHVPEAAITAGLGVIFFLISSMFWCRKGWKRFLGLDDIGSSSKEEKGKS